MSTSVNVLFVSLLLAGCAKVGPQHVAAAATLCPAGVARVSVDRGASTEHLRVQCSDGTYTGQSRATK